MKTTKCVSLIIFGFFVLTVTFVNAQINPANLTQYTEMDGVPGVQISDVVVDRFGYIWVGTINGLARYDGYEFNRFINDPNDSTSIKGLVVWGLHEDRKGRIWVGSSPQNLNLYNPATKSFKHYEFNHLIDRPENVEVGISAIAEDNQGRIYFGVQSNWGEEIPNALLYLDEETDTIKRFEATQNQPIKNINRIVDDQYGNVWFLSYSGFFKIDANRNISRVTAIDKALEKNEEWPSDLKITKDGHIWLITNKARLYNFDPSAESLRVYNPGNFSPRNFNLNCIALDSNENIWIGTGQGLFFFNVGKKEFEFFNVKSEHHLENAEVLDLQIDSFGTLWIGTNMKGLLKYEERAILKSHTYNIENPSSTIASGWVSRIIETRDKKIWTASSGAGQSSGLSRLDLQTNTINSIPYHDFLPGCFNIAGMTETAPSELLLSTNLGLYFFYTKTSMVSKAQLEGVPDNLLIYDFYNDSMGNQWLCTTDGLYKKQHSTGIYIRYDLSIVTGSNAGSNEITRAFESKKHGLWLATNNGLFLYDYATDKLSRHGFDWSAGDIFYFQDINSFYEQPDGTVWVGTWQGGLSRYNVETGKIKTFTQNDGLPSMSIQSILGDEENQVLWLSTFEGLSRFDIRTGQFNNYTITEGIQSQLFADGSYLKTSNGHFIFGGSNGITVFDPTEITKKTIPPIVILTDLKLFNKSIIPGEKSILKKPINETKEIALAHDQNNISIEFLAIHYSNSSKNRTSYKLENYDNAWREVSNRQDAFYPQLPPGKYVFRVKAANSYGVWNEEGATLIITITPPWWKTIWAYAIYTLIFILTAFAADRFFRHRLIQKERNRTRDRELAQAKEIEKAYHNLEQAHKTLKSTQSQLIQAEKMASLGELTAGIAHEIQNPLNFVNNFSEVSNELINELQDIRHKSQGKNANTEEDQILNDIAGNLQKINHHGKRAADIVKGMLQHSRTSSGVKEPTDINALADEYLRLAYHGLRAKDKSFNADFKADLYPSLPKVSVIPQDIGRVILNLINNAFYAVNERSKKGEPDYVPSISVTTQLTANSQLLIAIKDNGDGIPDEIVNKIFQPFFTTKPTGQGTGLGLSLSYDIITKGHNGTLEVDTTVGVGTEFIIQLPIV